MSGQDIAQVVDRIAENLGIASNELIGAYVPMVLASAWCWLIGLVVLFTVMALVALVATATTDDVEVKVFGCVVICLCIFIITLTFAEKYPTIYAPRAAAIKEILKDINTGN